MANEIPAEIDTKLKCLRDKLTVRTLEERKVRLQKMSAYQLERFSLSSQTLMLGGESCQIPIIVLCVTCQESLSMLIGLVKN